MDTDVLFWSFFALAGPFVAHMGAIDGDDWRPKARGLLKGRIGEFAVRRMNTILSVNGVFFAASYLAWELLEGFYFLIPLALAVPPVVMQITLAMESGRQATLRKGNLRK